MQQANRAQHTPGTPLWWEVKRARWGDKAT